MLEAGDNGPSRSTAGVAGRATSRSDTRPQADTLLLELARCLRARSEIPEGLRARLEADIGRERLGRLLELAGIDGATRARSQQCAVDGAFPPSFTDYPSGTPPARITTRPTVSPRTVLLIAAVGVFMAFIDDTVVGIAFPNLLRSFPHASLGGLSWVLNSYNLAFAALLVPAGRAADALGRRRVFVAGLVLFTLTSAACAAAPSLATLIATRALQGIGAAVIVPASLALVLDAYPAANRVQAVALWSAAAALAAGIGPSIGGVLVNASDWRLVFLVNLPIGIIAARVASRRLIESRAPGSRAFPDVPGALLLALAVGLLTFAIVQSAPWGWLGAGVVIAAAGSLAGAALLYRRCRAHPAPVIDLELMRMPGFAITGLVSLVGSAGFFSLGLANLLFLMQVWHYSPLKAGLAITPAPFVATAAAGLISRLSTGRDTRPLIVLGALVWAAGPVVLLLRMTHHPDYLGAYLPAALLLAVGIGIAFPLVGDAAVAGAPGERYAGASALNAAIRQIGAALGVAILAALIGHDAAFGLTGGFHRVWVFGVGCAVVVAVGALRMSRPPAPPRPPAPLPPPGAGARAGPEPAPGAARALASLTARATPRPGTPAGLADSPEELLASVPLFTGLEPADAQALAARATTSTVAAGRWLFHRGDAADALYVVQSGRLEVLATGGRLVRELTAGAVVGELALLSHAPRSLGIRARRDARLLMLHREDFEAMMGRPAFARSVARVLGGELQRTERPEPGPRSQPRTTAMLCVGERAAALRLPERLTEALARLTTVAYLDESLERDERDTGTRLAEALDRCELEHEHVLLSAGTAQERPTAWTQACLEQADRVVVVLSGPLPEALPPIPAGCEVVLHDCAGRAEVAALLERLQVRRTYRLAAGAEHEPELRRIARRLAGCAVGLVLSGGGARGFAQLGAIEELQAAGVVIDRVGGASMGAFIGGMLAQGMTASELDARCYEEWVRRRPLSDYRLPRVSLLHGSRARAMLARNLPGVIEDLPLSYFCVSTDMIAAELVVHRRGPLALSVGASMSVPGLVPPVELGGRLLVDGGVLDYLPVAPMAADREGPVIACDTSEHEVRAVPPGTVLVPPSLPEMLYKLVLLSSADPVRAAREHANLVIRPRCEGIGLLEFHMIDRVREIGRQAAREALEHAPDDPL
jgi:EmrB/QacA subfamily drug resistance transporter